MIKRAFAAVLVPTADQAFASLTPFIASLLLARETSPDDFGLFALLYASQTLVLAGYQGFVIDPMMVHAHSRPAGYLREVLLRINGRVLAVAAVASLFLGLAVALWTGSGLRLVLPFSASVVGAALLMLARRAQYAQGRPVRALLASVGFFAGVLALLVWRTRTGLLDTQFVFLCTAGLSAAIAIAFSSFPPGNDASAWGEHVQYGKWASAANLLSWIPLNVHFYLLSASDGLDASGQLRALYNLVLPAQLAIANLSFVLIPIMARKPDLASARQRKFWMLAGGLVGLAAAYLLVLALFAGPLLDIVYSGKYAGAGILVVLGVVPLFSALHVALSSALRARSDPRGVTLAYVQALAALPVAFLLVHFMGILGSALAMLSMYAVLDGFTLRRALRGVPHAAV